MFFRRRRTLLWLSPPPRDDEITRGRGNFGIFFPIYNTLYRIAFGTHTKTAEAIEISFGMTRGLGPRNSVLRGGDDPKRENFEENVPDKPNTPNNCGLVNAAAHNSGRRSIACVRRVYYRLRSEGVLPVLWMTSCFFSTMGHIAV